MSGLRHVSFPMASLSIGEDDPVLRRGDLLVARNEGSDAIDWELVVSTMDTAPIDHGAHHLTMVTAEGRVLSGDAILVRSVEGTHVFRGAGVIEGFDPTDLD